MLLECNDLRTKLHCCISCPCRYNGAARASILVAPNGYFASGFNFNCPGIAWQNGWMGGTSSDCLPIASWVLSADQINLYRAQRGVVNYNTGSSGLSAASSAKWTINTDSGYLSDWACAGLLHYNRVLSLAEVEQVEAWLDGLYKVVPPPPVLGESKAACWHNTSFSSDIRTLRTPLRLLRLARIALYNSIFIC
jgi:hypothetical protein